MSMLMDDVGQDLKQLKAALEREAMRAIMNMLAERHEIAKTVKELSKATGEPWTFTMLASRVSADEIGRMLDDCGIEHRNRGNFILHRACDVDDVRDVCRGQGVASITVEEPQAILDGHDEGDLPPIEEVRRAILALPPTPEEGFEYRTWHMTDPEVAAEVASQLKEAGMDSAQLSPDGRTVIYLEAQAEDAPDAVERASALMMERVATRFEDSPSLSQVRQLVYALNDTEHHTDQELADLHIHLRDAGEPLTALGVKRFMAAHPDFFDVDGPEGKDGPVPATERQIAAIERALADTDNHSPEAIAQLKEAYEALGRDMSMMQANGLMNEHPEFFRKLDMGKDPQAPDADKTLVDEKMRAMRREDIGNVQTTADHIQSQPNSSHSDTSQPYADGAVPTGSGDRDGDGIRDGAEDRDGDGIDDSREPVYPDDRQRTVAQLQDEAEAAAAAANRGADKAPDVALEQVSR